jgi:DNA invertase Pin-like site-specific DNA recombinase
MQLTDEAKHRYSTTLRRAPEIVVDDALIFGALAEFERDLIRERTQAGLAAARARGRKGGRKPAAGLSDERKRAIAQSLYNDKQNSIAMICDTLHVSRATLYRYITTRSTLR